MTDGQVVEILGRPAGVAFSRGAAEGRPAAPVVQGLAEWDVGAGAAAGGWSGFREGRLVEVHCGKGHN